MEYNSSISNFQAGKSSPDIPVFQAGLNSIPNTYGKGSTIPLTNIRIHYPYSFYPFTRKDNDSPYLDQHYVFTYSHEHKFNVEDELAKKWFSNTYRRKPTADGGPHRAKDGYSESENVIGLNLPMVNLILANLCNQHKPTVNDKNSDCVGDDVCERYLLPSVNDILALICPMGGMVTQQETRRLRYSQGTADVRNICLGGAIDVRNYWGCFNIDPKNRRYIRLRPKTKVGFVLRVRRIIELLPYGGTTLTFMIDDQLKEQVEYKKEIVWRVEPFVFGCFEENMHFVNEYTFTKLFLIGEEEMDEEGEITGKTIKPIVYEPHFWRVGSLGGPSTDGEGTKEEVVVKDDVCCNFNQINVLPSVELMADFLTPVFKNF